MWEVFFLGTARRTDSQRSASSGGTVMAMGMEGRAKATGARRGIGEKRRIAIMMLTSSCAELKWVGRESGEDELKAN